MECIECKTFKKADNCQKCYIELKNEFKNLLNDIEKKSKILHITSLDKIKEKILKQKGLLE